MLSTPHSSKLFAVGQITARSGASLRWQRAYLAAVANAALFFVFSALALSAGNTNVFYEAGITTLFFVGSVLSFYLLVRAGAALAAVSFYVIGTGLFFGLGTTLFLSLGDNFIYLVFTPEQQAEFLPKINLVNSVSVFIALICAWPLCRNGPPDAIGLSRWNRIVDILSPLRLPMFLLAVPIVFLKVASFPLAENLLLRSALGNLTGLVYLAILIGALRWSKLSTGAKIPTIVLFATVALLGFARLSKTDTLLPFVALAGGMLLDRRSQRALAIFTISSVLAYFFVIAPACNAGRNQPGYSAEQNSIPERIDIIFNTWSSPVQQSNVSQFSALLQRIVATPYQAFLIERYDRGAPGGSISDAWQALIPRAIWRDKPNITRFGTELDILFFNRDEDSALAPTYTAEAYWNGGWLELIVISILVGLELGWFTGKWNRLMHGGKDVGIFFFTVPVVLSSFWVENWFVATYVGGFFTLLILIKTADFVLPMIITKLLNRRRPKPAFSGTMP